MGCETAALTHGHPTGWLTAGFLALMISELVGGGAIEEAAATALDRVQREPDSEETVQAVERALEAVRSAPISAETVESLGEGWIAEEALAIALYCALVAREDFSRGVRLAVNHSGDSDSTGAIAGNLLGARLGRDAIPTTWLERLELREVIERVAVDLHAVASESDRMDMKRYPPN